MGETLKLDTLNSKVLLEKIKSLSDEEKEQVVKFIDLVKVEGEKVYLKERAFGCLKGKIQISDNFDKPILYAHKNKLQITISETAKTQRAQRQGV